VLSDKLEQDYTKVRKANKVLTLFPFSSDRKRMSTVIEGPNNRPVLHSKGASEIILGLCTRYVDADVCPLVFRCSLLFVYSFVLILWCVRTGRSSTFER
jgi:magnesium-transporting ATPase (P-type)